MKVNEVNVIHSRTVQMRMYEPAVISVSIKAQVDPTDDPAGVIATIRRIAREEVEIERVRLLNERMASVEEEKEKAA